MIRCPRCLKVFLSLAGVKRHTEKCGRSKSEPLPLPHPHDLPVLARHGIKLDQWWNMTPEQRRDARDSVAHANYQENQ